MKPNTLISCWQSEQLKRHQRAPTERGQRRQRRLPTQRQFNNWIKHWLICFLPPAPYRNNGHNTELHLPESIAAIKIVPPSNSTSPISTSIFVFTTKRNVWHRPPPLEIIILKSIVANWEVPSASFPLMNQMMNRKIFPPLLKSIGSMQSFFHQCLAGIVRIASASQGGVHGRKKKIFN